MNVNRRPTLYIANPLSGRRRRAFSTHPPMADRIRRLKELDAANGIHY
jgi:Zn-dependent protease with chaperone function